MEKCNLSCSANSCVYNTSGSCYAGAIKVDGKQATTTSNTFCSSYVDRAASGINNVANGSNEVCTNNIRCEAYNCKYNEEKLCKADEVHINKKNASCETFVFE